MKPAALEVSASRKGRRERALPPRAETVRNAGAPGSTLRPVSVARLYRVIADQIKDKISDGSYRAEDRLPSERELAELLQVSRPSVREALIALEIEGWVDIRVGSGVYVTGPKPPLNPRDAGRAETTLPLEVGAADLLQARLLIEPQCAELAARNATDAQLEAIERAVLDLPGSEQPYGQDARLHVLIAEASGSAALESLVRHLWALIENCAIFTKLNQHFVDGRMWGAAHEEHLSLLRALRRRQPAAARRAMRAHLLGVRSRIGLDARQVEGS